MMFTEGIMMQYRSTGVQTLCNIKATVMAAAFMILASIIFMLSQDDGTQEEWPRTQQAAPYYQSAGKR